MTRTLGKKLRLTIFLLVNSALDRLNRFYPLPFSARRSRVSFVVFLPLTREQSSENQSFGLKVAENPGNFACKESCDSCQTGYFFDESRDLYHNLTDQVETQLKMAKLSSIISGISKGNSAKISMQNSNKIILPLFLSTQLNSG